MSVIKDTIKYINSSSYTISFDYIIISDIIYKNNTIVQNIEDTVEKYLMYLLIANFIKVEYTVPLKNSFAIAFNINLTRNIYTKNCNIPENLNYKTLIKLAEDEEYRLLYMRKLKLKQIKT